MRTGQSEDARLLYLVLFLAGVAISAFTILQGIDPFDEGIVLQAARRIASGQVPYRDFSWSYGPALPYVLAGLIKLFGISLLHWRILRSLADGAIALTAYALVRPYAPRWLALLTWLAAACEMAEPRNANPFPFALLAILVALWLLTIPALGRRTLIGAVVLTGVAAAFRLDFALYGLFALTVALLVRDGIRLAVVYAAGAILMMALVYLPFAIADGPGSLYQSLIGVSLSSSAYWSLPFPWVYRAAAHAGIGQTLKHALDFYVPLISIISLATVAVIGAATARNWRDRQLASLLCGVLALGVGLLLYMLSRTDVLHTQPIVVIAAIGLGLAATTLSARLALLPLVLLSLLALHGIANRLSALAHPPAEVPLRVAGADGVMVAPREARAIERMVALVDARVRPGAPIYVLPRRSDLVRLGDPLIYVLTQRTNPAYADFGLFTGAASQAGIVRLLERVRPAAIVRWTDPMSSEREPNLRGRSSGVHTVDRWVAIHYRPLAILYHYVVLIPRGASSPPR